MITVFCCVFQTMTSLFRNVLVLDSGDCTIKCVDLLIGFNSADVQMQLLLRSLTAILTNSPLNPNMEDDDDDRTYPTDLKSLVLKLILTILTVRKCESNLVNCFVKLDLTAKAICDKLFVEHF